MGKAEKPAFSPFPIMFSTLPKTNLNFSVRFILSSASAFNLDQSKNLAFRKELTIHQMLDCSKIKAFADNKIK